MITSMTTARKYKRHSTSGTTLFSPPILNRNCECDFKRMSSVPLSAVRANQTHYLFKRDRKMNPKYAYR